MAQTEDADPLGHQDGQADDHTEHEEDSITHALRKAGVRRRVNSGRVWTSSGPFFFLRQRQLRDLVEQVHYLDAALGGAVVAEGKHRS